MTDPYRRGSSHRSACRHRDRHVPILRRRFQDGVPIRQMAAEWGIEAATLHHEYAKARDEFRSALNQVVAEHHPGTPAQVGRECARLISLFS